MSAYIGCCAYCGKRFRRTTLDGKRAVGSLWMLRHDRNGLFCSMRHAALWAVADSAASNEALRRNNHKP